MTSRSRAARILPWAGASLLALGLAGVGCDKAQSPEAKPETVSQPAASPEPEPLPAPDHHGQRDTADAADPAADNAAPERLEAIELEPLEGDRDTHTVKTEDAGPAGAGYTMKGLARRGWSRSAGPHGSLSLSGPPGGPLGVQIRPYPPGSASMPLDALFVAWTGQTADAASESSQISLGGAPRDAQAFRTGESLATTAHCLVRVPSGQPDKGGWWIMFYAGGSENQDPSCTSVIEHQALAPLVKTFALVR